MGSVLRTGPSWEPSLPFRVIHVTLTGIWASGPYSPPLCPYSKEQLTSYKLSLLFFLVGWELWHHTEAIPRDFKDHMPSPSKLLSLGIFLLEVPFILPVLFWSHSWLVYTKRKLNSPLPPREKFMGTLSTGTPLIKENLPTTCCFSWLKPQGSVKRKALTFGLSLCLESDSTSWGAMDILWHKQKAQRQKLQIIVFISFFCHLLWYRY